MSAPTSSDDLLSAVWRCVDANELEGALALLRDQPPISAAVVYEKVQGDLYWSRKNIPLLVTLSQAGILHLQQVAGPDDVSALLSHAKTLAYNLASYTWPGWDEPGIVLTRSHVAAGWDAARLNARLATDLDKPAKAKANALWLLGAHQLAQSDPTSAIGSFAAAEAHAKAAGEAGLIQMLQGYESLARHLAQPDDPTARAAFEDTVSAISRDRSVDAQEYARQLRTAHSVFRGTGFQPVIASS